MQKILNTVIYYLSNDGNKLKNSWILDFQEENTFMSILFLNISESTLNNFCIGTGKISRNYKIYSYDISYGKGFTIP